MSIKGPGYRIYIGQDGEELVVLAGSPIPPTNGHYRISPDGNKLAWKAVAGTRVDIDKPGCRCGRRWNTLIISVLANVITTVLDSTLPLSLFVL